MRDRRLARPSPELRVRLAAGGIGGVFRLDATQEIHGHLTLARTDQLPYEMKSSLLNDLESGRRLELPWLSGAIVRMGQEHGVPTPTHAFITTALKLHAAGA